MYKRILRTSSVLMILLAALLALLLTMLVVTAVIFGIVSALLHRDIALLVQSCSLGMLVLIFALLLKRSI